MREEIKKAIKILKNGGIVIFPTDTAFGIGCRIDDEVAIERLFRIRKRPVDQPTTILVDSIEMAKKYWLSIPSGVRQKLINKYWPGALTVILPCKINLVPKLVRGGGETLGIRMPDYQVIRYVIEALGVPILGPSANFHSEKTPYKLSDLNPELVKLVDYILPGECRKGRISTVIDCSVSPWKILRDGAVKIQNSEFKIQNSERREIILMIDTASNQEIKVGISIGQEKRYIKQKISKQKAQVVLPIIEKLLENHQLKPADLTGIEVNRGPGSFTGLRVGVAIANALSFALNIPLNNTIEGLTEPVYD